MNNPYAAVYPPGQPGAQQPIATAPPPGMMPMPSPTSMSMPMPQPMPMPTPQSMPMPTLQSMPMPMPTPQSMPMPTPQSMPQSFVPVVPQSGWSPPSTTYPPGLEYLMGLDYLFVNQKVELLEAFTGFETKNRFAITDVSDKPLFYAAEESGICTRLCLGSYRPCEFSVLDQNRREEILRLTRPFRCDSCCCPCYLQEMEVHAGGVLLGSITQEWSIFRPTFTVRDASGQPVLIIKGPIIRCCIEVTFKIKSLDEKHKVGIIQKKWSGLAREFFTDSDKFGIQFPRDLDVKVKALLLGACILLNFMYFENTEGFDLSCF